MQRMSLHAIRATAVHRPISPCRSHVAGSCIRGAMSEQLPAAACRMAEPIFRAPDTLVKISPSDALARRALSWPGMAVETAEVTQPCRIEVRFCAPVHLLVLFEEGVRRKGLSCIEGRPRSGLRNLKGKLVFVPSGHEYYDWQEPSRLSRAAYFYFDTAVLPSKSETGHAAALLAPRLFFEDAGVRNIAIRLKALIEGGGPVDRLYCESLGVVLAHELARLGSGGARVEPAVRGGLAGWQQRAVSNYIEEHIADEIPLATMAQLARLSPITFAVRSSRHSAFRSIDSTCAVASNALRHCCGVPWPRSPRSAWPWGSPKQAHSRRRFERPPA
jgi:hypothetical protein